MSETTHPASNHPDYCKPHIINISIYEKSSNYLLPSSVITQSLPLPREYEVKLKTVKQQLLQLKEIEFWFRSNMKIVILCMFLFNRYFVVCNMNIVIVGQWVYWCDFSWLRDEQVYA